MEEYLMGNIMGPIKNHNDEYYELLMLITFLSSSTFSLWFQYYGTFYIMYPSNFASP